MTDPFQKSTEVSNSVVYTPREAILHSANLLRSTIQVQGSVVRVDAGLGRMDLADNGAKLITRLPASLTSSEGEDSSFTLPQLDEVVILSGVLRKEQRRTFLMVSDLKKVKVPNE